MSIGTAGPQRLPGARGARHPGWPAPAGSLPRPPLPAPPRPGPAQAASRHVPGVPESRRVDGQRLRVLLIEDDEADAFLVHELLEEAGAPFDLAMATSMAQAAGRLAGVDCVLLDLGLPDASGLTGLKQLLHSTTAAVCVLTGLEDEHQGIAAVAEGAQDYLIKGQVDGVLLTRAVRYAVERRRADENARKLREVELRQAESARLERGLLPQPLISDRALFVEMFYRAGRGGSLLGGDFFDAVQTSPGTLSLVIGDVAGHDVDQAALGVELRVAWRALTLAGVPDGQVLSATEQVLVSERHSEEVFATLASVTIDLHRRQADVRLAGHPPPLLISGGRATPCRVRPGTVLGVLPGQICPLGSFPLERDDWAVLMYTDGVIEGRRGGLPARAAEPRRDTTDRLGIDGLCDLIERYRPDAGNLAALPAHLVGRAEELNGGPLADDVAMLLVHGGNRLAHGERR